MLRVVSAYRCVKPRVLQWRNWGSDVVTSGIEPAASKSSQLNNVLDDIVSSLKIDSGVTAPVKPSRGRRRRSRRRMPRLLRPAFSRAAKEPGKLADTLHKIEPTAACKLLLQQQESYRQQLAEDRKLIWYQDQKDLSALVERSSKDTEDVVTIDPLPEEVVLKIIREMTLDPSNALAEIRDEQILESLALHLEQVLTSNPPDALHDILDGIPIRIISVEAPNKGPCIAYFDARTGCDVRKLQQQLDGAAMAVSSCLAQRLMVTYVPRLRFVPSSVEKKNGEVPKPQYNWRTAKRIRRLTVHNAMHSWSSNMCW